MGQSNLVNNANTISINSHHNNTNITTTTNDLLDLLGGIDLASPVMAPGFIGGGGGGGVGQLAADTSNGNHLFGSLDTFGGGSALMSTTVIPTTMPTPTSLPLTAGPPLTALDKNGITVVLVSQKSSGCLQVRKLFVVKW